MRKIIFLVIGFMIIAYSFMGCKNDKAELLYPPDVCDTINVTYSSSILPILRDNCYRCHAGSSTVGPFNLDSYNDVAIRAASGELRGAVNHLSGFVPMPKDAGKLSDCNVAKINKWLDDGFPNN
ncbi:MAG: hypothetical protein ABI402_14515 [Ferruginibacter sp.]